MTQFPSPVDLDDLAERYAVPPWAMEDLVARRRAGAHDGELVNLLRQPERGGLPRDQAVLLLAELSTTT